MEAIPRELAQNNWIVFLFIFGLILLFFMKVLQPSRFLGYSISFFTKGFIEKRAEEKPVFFSAFHGFLFTFTALTIAILLHSASSYLQTKDTFLSFLTLFLLVLFYMAVRYFLDFVIARLLNLSEYIRYFIFTKSGYLYTLAIWLFPVLIIYSFGFKNDYFLGASFLVLVVLRFALVFYNNKKLIIKHFFYFILYLCALEIAPLFILIKILK